MKTQLTAIPSNFSFPRAITAARLGLALLFAWAVTTTSSQAALIGYWNFDEGSGTTAADSSGVPTPHTGTLGTTAAGAQLPAWIPGRFGSALDFNRLNDGNGGRVTVPFQADLQLNNAFTISFWYRPGPNIGTFPGPMRIGSQSATTGANIGWGFFRSQSANNVVFKRGNVQPNIYPTRLVNGQWYHIVLRHDGGTANTAIMFGVTTNTVAQSWLDATSTGIFEFGRMDQHDDCDLDDIAFFDEAVPLERIYTVNSVPSNLGVDYNLVDVRALWAIFDGGPGSSGTVKGITWAHTTTLPGSTTPGDAYLSGTKWYVVLSPTAGLVANAILLMDLSPAGFSNPGTQTFPETPAIGASARFVFDLSGATTVGGGVNDLFEVTGDLNVVNNSVIINPLAPLATGTYRLFNYTGTKSGSFNPTVIHNSRYTITLDESISGQINLNVSGSNGDSRWNSASSGVWDLSAINWSNTVTMTTDRFFQADTVTFGDTAVFQTNISIATAVFPSAITVSSSSLNYSFSGSPIGGLGNGLVKNGTGTLALNSANNFVGPVTVNAGLLKLASPGALGRTNGGTLITSGATLDLGGAAQGAEPITVAGAGLNSTGAVINTGASIVNSGLSGPVTLTGDTTFGGINRWDVFGGSLAGNGFKLTKTGPPEIALSNLGETGLGDIDVLQGVLTILGNSTMGDPTKTLTLSPNAALAFWATGPTILNKPIVMNSAILRNATSGNTDVSTNLGAITLNGDANFQATANIALLGPVGGPGNLIKVNAGTLYLGGVNTYSGRTTLSAGRLALLGTGSIANSPGIDVQPGTTLDVSRLVGPFALSSGQTLSGSGTVAGSLAVPVGATVSPGVENVAATLTVTNGLVLAGGTLAYELAAATTEGAGVNDLITVGGNLDLTGVSTISVNPLGLLTVGNVYTLISYTGALTGLEANLAVVSNSRYSFALSLATSGKVLLTVTGGAAADLVWLGGTPGSENLWDLKTTPNWSDGLGAESTFFGGDKVLFDDFGGTSTIELVGSLTPAAVRIENGALDYVFQGSGRLSGNSPLTKVFDAKLTIANTGVNDYVGATTIAGGTVQVGTGGTFGNLGSGPITNNATLIYNRSDNLTIANTLAGTGSFIKQNANLMILSGANSSYSGAITAGGGTLRPANSNALGNATGGTTVAAGATLDVNAFNYGAEGVTAGGAGVGGAGAIVNSGAVQSNALRFVTLAGHTTVGGTGRWDIRADPTAELSTGGNSYNLTKVGANQVSVVGAAVDAALGDINVAAGILSMELAAGAGDPSKTLTVANGATIQFVGRTVPWSKNAVLNGGRNVLNANGDTTMNGTVALTAPVTFENAGTTLTVNGPISGPGSLTKTGANPLALGSDNSYTGGTVISAGVLQLGIGGNSGSVLGSVANNGTLSIYRGDAYTLTNPITGTGAIFVRTTNGLTLSSTPLNPSTLSVGNLSQGLLIVPAGITVNAPNFNLGDSSTISGDGLQTGGDITVSALMRVGHWPSPFVSTYVMGGGTLTLTATPAGVVNQAGVAEQNGIIYLGIDGTGVFMQTGGVARAHGIVLDARGNTAGTDIFTLNGGRFTVGPSGIKSGSLDANLTYAINLGGGTLASSGNWTSVLNMSITGTNGDVKVDSSGFDVTLNGVLSGPGGLVKQGAGALRLNGANNFAGTLLVGAGTLTGNGAIGGPVVIQAGATLAPGVGLGTLTVNNTLQLGGTTVMEINKAGTVLSGDRIAGNGAITYGGTLTVVASGAALVHGDAFNLFDGSSLTGSFTTINLPTLGANLAWDLSKLASEGIIRVTGPELAIGINAGNISLAWPDAFANFLLQAQTNAPGLGITGDWVTVLGLTTNRFTFPVVTDPAVGSIFYRLQAP